MLKANYSVYAANAVTGRLNILVKFCFELSSNWWKNCKKILGDTFCHPRESML